MTMPKQGWSKEEVFAALETHRKDDVAWRTGRVYAYVYDGGAEIEAVAKHAFTSYLSENGLDPTAFPSLLKFENELLSMARAHLHGDAEVEGSFTSGGTESIILAVKAARDFAKATRGVEHPEMIVPVTAHAAFHKAGHYLGVKVIATDVDPVSFRADVASMEQAISQNTVLIVGSASGYAHGVVDPIEAIAELASKKGILCHVDGCIGGFMLNYFARLGAKVPLYDFRVPGVTSISMDLHKYGLTPKGASVVLYRNAELRRHQYYMCASWTGYTMINPTVQSSKSGGPLAAAWAVMNHVGDAGYLAIAEGLLNAKNALVAGINAIDGLAVMGDPEMCLIGFTSDDLPLFAIADEMKTRGWHIQAQLAYGPSKENLHLSVNPSNVPWTEEFLRDLRASVEVIRATKARFEDAAAFAKGVSQSLEGPDAMAKLPTLIAALGVQGGKMPEKMNDIHVLMNSIPRKLQEVLLSHFISGMFVASPPTGAAPSEGG